MVFLESSAGAGTGAGTRPVAPEIAARAARRALRDQIARLERDLGAALLAV